MSSSSSDFYLPSSSVLTLTTILFLYFFPFFFSFLDFFHPLLHLLFSNTHFTKAQLTLKTAIKENRKRYGRLIRAITKVIEQLNNSPTKKTNSGISSGSGPGSDAAKIATLEELVAKASVEVEKAKEKKRETDRRTALAVEEKIKKDLQKEILRLKKEELDMEKEKEKEKDKEIREKEKEKERVLKEKEKKVPTEKEIKQASDLKLQRSMFSGFFKSEKVNSSSSATTSSTTSTSSISTSSANGVMSNTTSSTSSTYSKQQQQPIICLDGVQNLGPESVINTELRSGICDPGFDAVAFEVGLKAGLCMSEISRTLREK